MIRRNLLMAWSLAVASHVAFAGLTTQDLNTLTPDNLATVLAGTGVVISNVTYRGAPVSAGTFAGGADSAGGTAGIGIANGVILSSGNIASVVGPNTLSNVSTNLQLPGDPDLDVLAGRPTLDATVLEFDFIPNADQVFFQYIFASDEYNEFVNSNFNDVFAFFVNGVNCAMVGNPAVPVSVNTINNGNPFGSGGPNAVLYKNNDLASGASINTEMDGLTVVLPCQAAVTPNATNRMKLAIADAQDSILDSIALVKGGSITTLPPVEATLANTQFRCKGKCTVRVTCNFAGPLGSQCVNRIRLFVRRNILRSNAETPATKAPNMIRFAFGITNIAPGQTANVRLKLTNRAKRFVETTNTRTIRAVMEISNVAGTAVLPIPVRIRLR